ncbi:GATA zinc finger domain-containing protein [Hirsutella rhossiliensis]|uniref:GATA zinc finger domain-containing protein n=1 Tax=Hirsutella rhossiliensis TaxID=111463 RepID=A0A9P8N2F9_9HYPO|nr:GATA zinc finger domain-containing protein [Hirsutella rhossiliensis]KAH0964619.1 GATA zinc finger domain-containing protein [Hirsutella rhossiliensis]
MSGSKPATRLLPGDGLGFHMMRSEADQVGFPLFISHSPLTHGSPPHPVQPRADATRVSKKSKQPPRAKADGDILHPPKHNHSQQPREQEQHRHDAHHSRHRKSGVQRKQRTRNSRMKCHACGTGETPEWRCGPDGLGTLCNVCGLVFAKQQRRRSGAWH